MYVCFVQHSLTEMLPLSDECVVSQPDPDAVFCALESTHAALAIMTHQDMPKQLYKEEVWVNDMFFLAS